MVEQPLVSVVIPTRNRADLLVRVVRLLLDQESDLGGRVEVVVVDDGSDVDAERMLREAAERTDQGDRIQFLRQSPQGPAAARNRGVRAAQAPLILFIGDDILPLPGLLRHHIHAHTVEYPDDAIAVLGMADLAPDLSRTPFVRWWRKWNFRYDLLLSHSREPDFSFFYTNNLSLKRSYLLQHGLFDESFRDAAYEDGELGLRLIRQGLKVVFKPQAEAIHYHEMDLASACRRMTVRGRSHDLFVEKTGALGLSKLWMRLGSGFWMHPSVIRPLYRLADWCQTRVVLGPVYILVMMYYFQTGRGNRPLLFGDESGASQGG